MKKNFFKKLSFVMALAMMISVIAPAAGAFGATSPKLNSTKKYLFLGTEDANEYDFNIKNKKTGWKYSWTTADDDIVSVNKKNGLATAVAVGTTKVSVTITDKDGEEVDELSATVIVKDNIATLKITNTPADNKLAVGKENDFNRSYVTVSGSTTKTTGVTRWSVDKEGATISDAGVFVATKAGTYKITANAFQSKAKYESWLVDKTKYASYVTATTDYTVTVPNSVKKVSATKSNAIKVEFAAPVTAVDKANFTVTNASTTSKLYIKSVELSSDKTYATINLYDTMVTATAYKITAKVDGADMTADLNYVKGVPTKITAATAQAAPANENYTITYAVLDANGVDITADTTVAFESSYNSIGTTTGVIKLAKDVLEYVWVVYTNPSTGEQIKSERIAVTGVASTGSDVTAYTLSKSETSAVTFASSQIKTAVGLNETGFFVRFKYKDQYGNEGLAIKPTTTNDGITFESLDPNIFVVDAITGLVTPVAVGTGNFRIKMGNINVIKTLTVRAEAVKSSLAFKWGSGARNVSDTGYAAANDAWMVVEYFNQYNEKITTNHPLKFKVLAGGGYVTKGGALLETGVTYDWSSNAGASFDAKVGITEGATTVIKVWNPENENMYTTMTFNVSKAENVQTGYIVRLGWGQTSLDINQKYDGDSETGDFKADLMVYTVNSANQVVTKVTGTSITVTGPNGKTNTVETAGETVYTFDTTDPSKHGTAEFDFRTGTYTVSAKKNGTVIATSEFTVKDSGTAPSVVYKSNNDFVGSVLTTSALKDKLTGLDGYTLDSFQFTSADTTKVASTSSWSTVATIGGKTTLYNVKIKVLIPEVSILTGAQTGVMRAYEINIGNLDVSLTN